MTMLNLLILFDLKPIALSYSLFMRCVKNICPKCDEKQLKITLNYNSFQTM